MTGGHVWLRDLNGLWGVRVSDVCASARASAGDEQQILDLLRVWLEQA
jgi:hypothetical protein